MAIHIFYHSNDLDGHCSGALLKHANPEAILHPINYGDVFPWDEIKPEDTVYMADFSLPMCEMYRLADCTYEFHWIDHHKSAIEAHWCDVKNADEGSKLPVLSGIRDTNFAACELVWKWLYPDKSVPKPIELLGIYDTWRGARSRKWNQLVLPFQYGCRCEETDPTRNWPFWQKIFENLDYATRIIKKRQGMGRAVLLFQKQLNASIMRACACETDFEGLRALVLNSPKENSLTFESMYDPAKHDIMIAYSNVKGEYWTVSLYSDKLEVDCSELAKKYGGGGHRGAAGMTLKELPFGVI